MGCWRPLERKGHPQPPGAGSKQGARPLPFRFLDPGLAPSPGSERGERPPLEPSPTSLRGGLPQCRQAAGCSWFGRVPAWGQWLSILGSPWPGLTGPLCSEEERQQRASAIWAGAGSRELLSWLRKWCTEGPAEPCELGKSLVLAALVGIALSRRKCLLGRKGNRAAFVYPALLRDYGVSSGLAPSKGWSWRTVASPFL